MNVTYRIPTKDQYAFIELQELDVPTKDGLAEHIREVYDEVLLAFKDSAGLPSKDFSAFIDTYLSTGSPPEKGLQMWEVMSMEQKVVVNEIKKSLKRINKN